VSRPRRHPWIHGLLLVALAFRALIPAGFMPSADRPLALEICRGGYLAPADYGHGVQHPAQNPAQHPAQHPAGTSQVEQCPFAAAPSAGLLPSSTVVHSHLPTLFAAAADFEPLRFTARLARAHAARGPPRLA